MLALAGIALSPIPTMVGVPASTGREWTRLTRMLLTEGYFAPFQPRLHYDARQALAIAQGLGADAFRFPALALYAYYPTRTRYPQHPELEGRDLLGQTTNVFHKAGLKVVPYLPINQGFLQVSRSIQGFDDCLRRTASGKPMTTDRFTYATCYETCLNSPIRELIKDYTREVLTTYPVDAMYFDGPNVGGDNRNRVCYCRHCRDGYQKARNKELPNNLSQASKQDQIDYWEWVRTDVIEKIFVELVDLIRQTRDVPIFENTTVLNKRDPRSYAFRFVDGFMNEFVPSPERKLCRLQAGQSSGKMAWCYIGSHGHWVRDHLKGQPGYGWYSGNYEGQELLMDGAVAIAAGAGQLYWGLNRLQPAGTDPMAYPDGRYVHENYAFSARHDALLRRLRADPDAGLLVGQQTLDWYDGPNASSSFSSYFYGAYSLMKDCSYDAEPFLDFGLTLERLARYRLVLVPNAICLSDSQCTLLAKYVENGGTLVATHLTSSADQYGRARRDFGLAELLGVRLLHPEAASSPDVYFRSTSGGSLVPQDFEYVRFEALPGTEVVAHTFDRAREKVAGPAIVRRSHGRGRVLYIGSSIEAAYEETRMAQMRDYFRGLLDPLLAGQRHYSVGYRGGLTAQMSAAPDDLVLHLLANTGNKWKQQHASEEYLPLENVQLRIRVPTGRKVTSVKLLRADQSPEWNARAGWVNMTVPRVLIHEAIHISLSS